MAKQPGSDWSVGMRGGGSSSGSSRGAGGYSYRSSELSSAERRVLTKQNKAAKSLQAKDLDKLDKNKVNYAKQKEARKEQLKGAYKTGQKVGATKAVIGVATLGALGQQAVNKINAQSKAKATPKPTVKPAVKPKANFTKSERDFKAGQKLKAKELKKTGVYKNTAN